MKWVWIALVTVGLVAGGGGYWYLRDSGKPRTSFRTAVVERGELAASISATGTIEPEEVVDVGAQVAGQIISFGADPRDSKRRIDYGSPVEEDTVLARIDESVYRSQVNRAKAQVGQAQAAVVQAEALVAQAEANVKRAEADVDQMKARYNQANRDFVRAKQLEPSKAVADSEYDTAEASYRTSRATVAVGEATVLQTQAALKDSQANVLKAKAALSDAQAVLENAEINLGYCTIKSPVKGVIVDRRVNVGQTVVSSLNAPSLFLIAKDLKRLEVWASVNEADIGNIHSGQPVTFTVDAYPGRVFHGTVAEDQPRLNASMTQNVVTYTVVVDTDNSDGKLKPYLTANLQFEVDKHSDVLLVPSSALRWKPNPQQVVPEARDAYVSSQRRNKGQPGENAPPAADKEPHNRGVVWVEDGGLVRPVKVLTGLSNGLQTEILKGDLDAGVTIVVGESRSNGDSDKSNPFAPKMFGGKKSN